MLQDVGDILGHDLFLQRNRRGRDDQFFFLGHRHRYRAEHITNGFAGPGAGLNHCNGGIAQPMALGIAFQAP